MHDNKEHSTTKARYLDVASRIENAVMRGEWLPGQRLPTLVELAAHFGVARSVIREACSLLIGSGLLELRQGDGTYVRVYSAEVIARPMHAAVLLGSSDGKGILQTCMWLEVGMVNLFARNHTSKEMDMLAQALFAMEAFGGDRAVLYEAERNFHMIFAENVNNSIGLNLLRILYQTLISVYKVIGENDPSFVMMMLTMHRSLYDCFIAKDPSASQRQIIVYRQALIDSIAAMQNSK